VGIGGDRLPGVLYSSIEADFVLFSKPAHDQLSDSVAFVLSYDPCVAHKVF
jgi:hypothetical protein